MISLFFNVRMQVSTRFIDLDIKKRGSLPNMTKINGRKNKWERRERRRTKTSIKIEKNEKNISNKKILKVEVISYRIKR